MSLEYWLPSHDSVTGTFALLVFAAGAVTALLFVLCGSAFRESGRVAQVLTFTVVLCTGTALVWGWLNHSVARELAADRRALDSRMTDLAARAISPGSALTCLDGVGIEVVEAACAPGIFATPQAVATAIAYVDARLALLADGLDHAARDKSYTGQIEKLRKAIEGDRFGVVAYILASRGCTPNECDAFKLLRNASRVKANLAERTFEASVMRYAADWRLEGPTASAPASAAPTNGSPGTPAVTSALPSQTQGVPPGTKYSFPSSASIPPVSIMSAEPTGPLSTEKTGTTPNQPRKQTARPAPKPQAPLPAPPQATMSNPGPTRP